MGSSFKPIECLLSKVNMEIDLDSTGSPSFKLLAWTSLEPLVYDKLAASSKVVF
jgi:hypothetical protein